MHIIPTVRGIGLLLVFSLLALSSASGCTEDDAAGADHDSGAPGLLDASADASEAADAAACEGTGTGSVEIEVTGLPVGLRAEVTITGPSGAAMQAEGSTTLADVAAGSYQAAAQRVANVSAIVRTVYEPALSLESFCLAEGTTQTLTVAYAKLASSGALWTSNSNSDSGELLGFAAAQLDASGAPAATVDAMAAMGGAVAFDHDGNLWTVAGTTADAPLSRFAAGDLGGSGAKTPDRTVAPELTGCSPALTALAFEPSGALWAADLCGDRMLRFSAETLSASSEYTLAADDIVSGGLVAPRGVAFDADGNMWVSDEASLHRYAAASLAPGEPHVATFTLNAKTATDAELAPDALAFDQDGNLWVTSFGGNVIYKLTTADLTPAGASKDVVPSVQISISVSALLESVAFDESGGLWLTYSQGKLARLAPSQLATSTTPGDPTIPETILTSTDLGYPGALAFFPAAAVLPLYSHLD